ncbi:mCG1050120 [Mus musculus]|nr:mCG1050120 [Mus musculus]
MELRGQLGGAGPLLPTCKFLESNLGPQVCLQMPLPAEPFFQSSFSSLNARPPSALTLLRAPCMRWIGTWEAFCLCFLHVDYNTLVSTPSIYCI